MLLVLVGGVMQVNADDYLPGTWNNWERNDASKFTYDDGGVGTLTLTLAGSTYYNFGIDKNGTWLKNSGTMVFNNCTNWTFGSGDGDNCTIRTTIAGDYIFTITWSGNTPSISVTYPGTYDDVVYFCNTVNWTQPNAYILHSSYWDEDKGSGCQRQPNAIAMTNVSGNVWKAEFPSGARSGYIAFTKDEQNGYGNFYATEAVYKNDFPNTGSYVYVPSTTSSGKKNEVDYYNNGEWYAYPTYTRESLNPDNLGTICLPFNATVTGAAVYKIVGQEISNGNLTGIYAEPVTNLVAGHAYIFKATSTSLTATYSGSYTAAFEADGMLGNLSSEPVNVPIGKGYYIIKNNLIRKVAAGTVTIGQYKAYITLKDIPTGAPTHSAPGLTLIDCDEEATGIEGLEIENNQDVIYDMQGRQVKDVKKGLFIINGKKVLVK